MLEVMEAMAGKIDRIEAQMQTIHAALATLTEIGLLTYAATGTGFGLPDEVIDAPIAEQAVMRDPDRIRVWRGTHEDQERHAALLRGGAREIEAELRRLKALVPTSTLAARIRLTNQIRALDQAMQWSFERDLGFDLVKERDRGMDRER